jgi:hypothetical protein
MTVSTIVPFLHRTAFSPEIVSAMSDAYDQAIEVMRTGEGEALENEIVARRIVELATSGVTDAAQLRDSVLDEFGIARPITIKE